MNSISKLEDINTRYLNITTNSDVIISHFGDFNIDMMDPLLNSVESILSKNGEKEQVLKVINRVIIELLENLSIHGQKDPLGKQHSFLVLAKVNERYKLFSGNLVQSEIIDSLCDRIDHLLDLDNGSLQSLYIETLSNKKYSDKGGAGLGLLTIFKRSKEIGYLVDKVDSSLGFFQLEISI